MHAAAAAEVAPPAGWQPCRPFLVAALIGAHLLHDLSQHCLGYISVCFSGLCPALSPVHPLTSRTAPSLPDPLPPLRPPAAARSTPSC